MRVTPIAKQCQHSNGEATQDQRQQFKQALTSSDPSQLLITGWHSGPEDYADKFGGSMDRYLAVSRQFMLPDHCAVEEQRPFGEDSDVFTQTHVFIAVLYSAFSEEQPVLDPSLVMELLTAWLQEGCLIPTLYDMQHSPILQVGIPQHRDPTAIARVQHTLVVLYGSIYSSDSYKGPDVNYGMLWYETQEHILLQVGAVNHLLGQQYRWLRPVPHACTSWDLAAHSNSSTHLDVQYRYTWALALINRLSDLACMDAWGWSVLLRHLSTTALCMPHLPPNHRQQIGLALAKRIPYPHLSAISRIGQVYPEEVLGGYDHEQDPRAMHTISWLTVWALMGCPMPCPREFPGSHFSELPHLLAMGAMGRLAAKQQYRSWASGDDIRARMAHLAGLDHTYFSQWFGSASQEQDSLQAEAWQVWQQQQQQQSATGALQTCQLWHEQQAEAVQSS